MRRFLIGKGTMSAVLREMRRIRYSVAENDAGYYQIVGVPAEPNRSYAEIRSQLRKAVGSQQDSRDPGSAINGVSPSMVNTNVREGTLDSSEALQIQPFIDSVVLLTQQGMFSQTQSSRNAVADAFLPNNYRRRRRDSADIHGACVYF